MALAPFLPLVTAAVCSGSAFADETEGRLSSTARSSPAITLEVDAGYGGSAYFVGAAHGWSHGYGLHAAGTIAWPVAGGSGRGLRVSVHYQGTLSGGSTTCGLSCASTEILGGRMVGGAVGYLHRVGRFWTSVGVAVTGVMHEGRVVLGEGNGDASYVLPALSLAAGFRIPLASRCALQAGFELETIVVSWSGRANLGLVVAF